jgi:hypothetical protein
MAELPKRLSFAWPAFCFRKRYLMKNKINKSIWIMPSVLLFLVSCAAIPKQGPYTHEEIRANLGTIGIVSASFQPEVRLQKPMSKGKAAVTGAAGGAGYVLKGVQHCKEKECAAVLVLVPVGAVVGSIVGAVKGVSSQKIKETEDILNGYLATVNFQETMRERFLMTVAKEQTQYPFFLLEVQGPNALDEEVTYGPLSDEGIDTILEIGLRKCQLWGEKDSINPNPPLHFLMAVGIRLIRTTDGHVLFNRNFVYDYKNVPLKFSGWGVNNAQRFREELDRAFRHLAMEIVKVLSNIQTPLNPPSSQVMEFE